MRRSRSNSTEQETDNTAKKMRASSSSDTKNDVLDEFLRQKVDSYLHYLKNIHKHSERHISLKEGVLEISNFSTLTMELLFRLMTFENKINKDRNKDFVDVDLTGLQNLFPYYEFEVSETEQGKEVSLTSGQHSTSALISVENGERIYSGDWLTLSGSVSIKYNTHLSPKQLNYINKESFLYMILKYGTGYILPNDNIDIDEGILESLHSETDNIYSAFVIGESHGGRNCGKGFSQGQPIYRCRECGMDDTCVLCFRCFNPDDHGGHHVMVHTTDDNTSGICDCGDADAWKKDLHCNADANKNIFEDETFVENRNHFINQEPFYKEIISVFLDYFIEVFKKNTILSPYIEKAKESQEGVSIEENIEMNRILSYHSDDSNNSVSQEDYFVLLFNDEYHTFSHVQRVLFDINGREFGQTEIPTLIDEVGYSVISGPDTFEKCLEVYRVLQEEKFSCKIVSWENLVEINAAAGVIKWIHACLSIHNPFFQATFRKVLSMCLLESSEASIKENPVYGAELAPMESDVFSLKNSARIFCLARGESGLFFNSFDIPLDDSLEYDIPYEGNASVFPNFTLQKAKNTTCQKSRLQNIFLLDFRYWKELRHEVSQIYLPILATDDSHKQIITHQYAEIFSKLIDFVGYLDREPQLTLMKECATQLFSNKSIVNYLAVSGLFPKIIWSSVKIFNDFSHEDANCTLFRRPQIFNATKGFHVAFKQSLYALETIFGNLSDSKLIFKNEIIFPLLTLFQLFNGAYKMKRKTGEHVLREDQFFITYVEYSMSLYTIVNSITHLLTINTPEIQVCDAVNMILEFFKKTPETSLKLYNGVNIIKFSVSKNRVGYMNPVNTFLGSLISFLPISTIRLLFKDYDFLQVSELPLRTLVLSSQTACGFWVRNGHSAAHQLQFYRDQLKTSAFFIDIFLNQVSLVLQPQRALLNIFYKWQFFDKDTSSFTYTWNVYEEKTSTMLSDLIKYLYLFISQRCSFHKKGTSKELEAEKFQQLVGYALVGGAQKYSHISELVEDHPLHSTLDYVLNSIADFSPPKGLNDEGVFILKKSYYKKVDFIHLLIFNTDPHSLLELINSKINGSKSTGSENEGFVIEPKLTRYEELQDNMPMLSSFSETAEFTEFIIQLLNIATENPTVTYTIQLLHLIHAVILDNQLYHNDSNFIPDSLMYRDIYFNIFKLSFIVDVNKYVKAKAILIMKMYMKFDGEAISAHIKSLNLLDNVDEKLEELLGRRQSFIENNEASLIKKKILIKKKQNSLLAKFKKNQQKFLKRSDGFNKDGELENSYEEEQVICSSCQETGSNQVFVIPCYMDNTPALRPFNLNTPLKDTWEAETYNKEGEYLPMAPTVIGDNHGYDNALISCNHPIHYECLFKYQSQFGSNAINFPCAVCQSLSNFFIPMFENDKPRTGEKRINVFEEKLLPSEGNASISSNLFYSDIVSDMLMHFKGFQLGSLTYEKFTAFQIGNLMYALSNILANSIAMLEASSRISDEPYLDFLTFNERQFKTLKAISEALTYYSVHHEKTPFNQFASRNGFNSNRSFQYIIDRYFLSDNSLEVTLGFALKQIFEKSEIMAGSKIEYCIAQGKKINVNDLKELNGNPKELYWIDKLQSDNLISCQASKILYSSDVFVDANGDSINFAALSNDKKAFILKNLSFTLAIAQIKVVLRKVCILVKVVNNFNEINAEDCDLINDQRINDGTDPEIFRGDDELYCDFLLSKLSNKKHTSIQNFLFSQHFRCSHDKVNSLNYKNYTSPNIENYSSYNMMDACTEDNCYYAKFYFQFLQGEDTGLIKLINLKHVLNDYILDQSGTKFNTLTSDYSKNSLLMKSLNSSICLSCGGKCFDTNDVFKLSENDYAFTGERRHMVMKCKSGQNHQNSSYNIFFQPNTNTIRLAFIKAKISHIYPDEIYMQETNGPYLNNHGEGWRQALGSGTTVALLNTERYDVWNQKWLNLEIPGYLSRSSGSQLVEILNTDFFEHPDKKMFVPNEILTGDISGDDLAYSDINVIGISLNSLLSTEFRQLLYYDVLKTVGIKQLFIGFHSLPEGYDVVNPVGGMKSISWSEHFAQSRLIHAKIYFHPQIDNGIKLTQDRYELWGNLNKTDSIPSWYKESLLRKMLLQIPQGTEVSTSADEILEAENGYIM